MAQSTSQIRILAQPQESYRERYNSELDPKRNRPKRFIRADPNKDNYEHPTIEVPKHWNREKKLFIRVTLVTVPTEQVPVICVHPYSIDAEETTENVIKDPIRNTLFFQITEDDFSIGHKSFRMTRTKTVQHDLKNYGQLRLLNSDQEDIQRIDDPTDARKLIEMYQLGKSELVFSLAELIYENQLPIIYDVTTIHSNTMTAISPTTTSSFDDSSIKCAPRRGSWEGGDEVLMTIPRIDRRKSFRLILEHSSIENIENIQVNLVDTRTISFFTPRCPIPSTGHQSIEISFVVLQGNEEIARANFLYQSFLNTNNYGQPTLMDPYFDDGDDDTSMSNTDFHFVNC